MPLSSSATPIGKNVIDDAVDPHNCPLYPEPKLEQDTGGGNWSGRLIAFIFALYLAEEQCTDGRNVYRPVHFK